MPGCRLLLVGTFPVVAALDTFVHPSGSDSAAGTSVAPLQTIAACVRAVRQPGDRCLLKAGVYPVGGEAVQVDDKAGTPSARVAIASAGDGPVVLDGTADISTLTKSTWRLAPEVGPHVYALPLAAGADITQLFAGRASAHDETLQMLVPARWPNARWPDRTMFEGPEHWAHAGPAGAGAEHNVSTMVGLLYDYGACRSNETCCSYCNNNSLSASGINATGAVMIMQLWSNGVGVQIVDQHTPGTNLLRYTATWCKAQIEGKHGKCDDGYRGGRGRYYLEASRALLDAPSEWFFEKETGMLYLYPPDGRSPAVSGLEIRAKVSTYALKIGGQSSFFDLANISFVGTTIAAGSDDSEIRSGGNASVHNLRFESLNFSYPSSSGRMLQNLEPIPSMAVWTNSSKIWTNHTFVDVAWRYADGTALQFQGLGGSFDNCVWEWNSWTGTLGSAVPGAWQNGGTFVVGSSPKPDTEVMFNRLSFANNGASKALRPPKPSNMPLVVQLVHFERQLSLADDGCFVETGGPDSAHMRYNWCTGSGKSAFRFDGDDATGTANGEMSFNVVWNNSGLSVKGNHQNISHNTIFDAADIGGGKAPHTYPSSQHGDSPLDFCGPDASINVENPGATTKYANNRSLFDGNLADRVSMWKGCTNANCPFAGTWLDSNVIGSSSAQDPEAPGVYPTKRFDIDEMLRDAWNHDFRACPGSVAAAKGAGAYAAWSAVDKTYLIPGAKRWAASQPSPKANDIHARLDAELLFLGAYRAIGHVVLFGKTGALRELATLHGEENIARPGPLEPHSDYAWRVVAQMADGTQRAGPTWSFTTGSRKVCVSKEAQPFVELSVPTLPSCTAALNKCCGPGSGHGDHGGDVHGQGDKCMSHVHRHNSTLSDPEAGCSLRDEQQFCDPCGRGFPFCDLTCNGMPERVGPASDTPALDSGPACVDVLEQFCAAAKRAGPGNCYLCAGRYQIQLEAAKCTAANFDAYCH